MNDAGKLFEAMKEEYFRRAQSEPSPLAEGEQPAPTNWTPELAGQTNWLRRILPSQQQKAIAEQELAARALARTQATSQQQAVKKALADQQARATEALIATRLGDLAENRARMQRLADARVTGRLPSPADKAQEEARQALSRALAAAIESGLLSGDRAIAMLLSGGLNDNPMSRDEAAEQVALVIAQAVAAGLSVADIVLSLKRSTKAEWSPRTLSDRFKLPTASEVRPVPVPEPDIRAEPDDPEICTPLEELLYAALTLQPCHESEHDEYHREYAAPCGYQSRLAIEDLISGLGVPVRALPRAPHLGPDGTKAACCRDDARVGTWLAHGRTRDPSSG